VYAARDDRAVRVGVGLNALCLLLYAAVPALLGMIAHANHPGLAKRDLALPTLLMFDVPAWVGSLGLAALFSAEISAADALLFMLATSLSQDLYRRFVSPDATDRQVLTAARLAAVSGGAGAVALAIVSQTVVDALSVFYTLLSVSLFVPVLAGLYSKRASAPEAIAAMATGVLVVVALQIWNAGRPVWSLTPALIGLIAAALAYLVVRLVRR